MTPQRSHDGLSRVRSGLGWPILRRVLSGGFLSLIGEGGARALSFLAAVLVARMLGVAGYGAFALVQGTVLAVSALAGFGLGHTAARYIAASRDTEPGKIETISGLTWRIAVLAGLIGTAAVWLAAPWLARTVLSAPELEGLLRILAPLLLFNALSNALLGTLQGFEVFDEVAKLNLMAGVLNFGFVVSGVVIGGLAGSTWGLLLSEIAKCGLAARAVAQILHSRNCTLLAPVDWRQASFVWTFSLPLLMGGVLHATIMWMCQAMTSQQPGGLVEVGLYDAAQKVMTLVALAPMAASAAIGPVLANLTGSLGERDVRSTTYWLAAGQFALTLLPAIGVALLAASIAKVFGHEFTATGPVIAVQMLLAPIFVLRHLFWQALLAQGHAWTVFGLSVLWAALALSATWVWLAQGAIGLSKAMILAYGMTLLCSVGLFERQLRRAR